MEKRAINIMASVFSGLPHNLIIDIVKLELDREYFVRENAATAIQARMRGCFARKKLEADVCKEIRFDHPWGPGVPSTRLLVLRANDRRMIKMRGHPWRWF